VREISAIAGIDSGYSTGYKEKGTLVSIAIRITIFLILTIFFTVISRRSLRNPRSHGFFRYFAFEGIAALVLYNHPLWFFEPFSIRQCISWIFLLLSIVLVLHGFDLLKRIGGQSQRNCCPENLAFENTQNLVQHGLYGYIRHPMYTSLLLLAWGSFLKRIDIITICIVVFISTALYCTAKVEEQENVKYFGDDYTDYRLRSKMFLPFIF